MSLKTVISEGNVETQVVSLTFPSKRLADIVKRLGHKNSTILPFRIIKTMTAMKNTQRLRFAESDFEPFK